MQHPKNVQFDMTRMDFIQPFSSFRSYVRPVCVVVRPSTTSRRTTALISSLFILFYWLFYVALLTLAED